MSALVGRKVEIADEGDMFGWYQRARIGQTGAVVHVFDGACSYPILVLFDDGKLVHFSVTSVRVLRDSAPIPMPAPTRVPGPGSSRMVHE